MSNTPPRCSHEFDPAATGADPDDYREVTDDDGIWRCPHQTDPAGAANAAGVPEVGETDRCPFHTDAAATDAGTLTESFRRTVADPDAPSEFLDVELGDVDLTYAVLEAASNRPIDLRHATIDGDFGLAHATVQQRLRLDDARLTGGLDCQYAQFDETLAAEGVTTGEGVNFEEATFREPVYLSDATFDGTCRWVEAEFRAGATSRVQCRGVGTPDVLVRVHPAQVARSLSTHSPISRWTVWRSNTSPANGSSSAQLPTARWIPRR